MITTLYDGTLGTFPAQQGELTIEQLPPPPMAPAAEETLVEGGVKLNTNFTGNNTRYVGYTNYKIVNLEPIEDLKVELVNPGFPDLILNEGFTVSFNLAINSETSTSSDRAGFSVLVVNNNARSGIELAFGEELIFAQKRNFVAGKNVAFDTTKDTNYDIVIKGRKYTLLANDTKILNGKLRNYNFDTNKFDPALPFSPYDIDNYMFFGDKTDVASAEFTLKSITIDQPVAIKGTPEDDVLIGTEKDDIIKGLPGNDELDGLGGDDLLKGGKGEDSLDGSSGNDTLRGLRGDDLLTGGTGDDLLVGQRGQNKLIGGEGADEFRFNAPFPKKYDEIMDFEPGVDLISIRARKFDIPVAGNPVDYFTYNGKDLFFDGNKLAVLVNQPAGFDIATDIKLI
ncbi:MAG: hypothetical protein DSM107014_03950 [Gomphosphaeria aponina SAG 52.96 = DSM 107014]|uniref:Calcium-binding protein n=1 Tax=Gomphosphaeria aponina SAG 52.96 = DSM 107014 TaxID=1521640 RepID=A0A941JP31_9CHRO|nr:hypothetical protein [Gomphosphaeria aponina SAG 52.96 = DSM 107014]